MRGYASAADKESFVQLCTTPVLTAMAQVLVESAHKHDNVQSVSCALRAMCHMSLIDYISGLLLQMMVLSICSVTCVDAKTIDVFALSSSVGCLHRQCSTSGSGHHFGTSIPRVLMYKKPTVCCDLSCVCDGPARAT